MSKVDGIKIQEKTTFNDVMTYGTKAQQRAFLVFDFNHDKIMQKDEARSFNGFDVKLEENLNNNQETLVLKSNNSNESSIHLCLTYSADDLAELENARIKDGNAFYYTDKKRDQQVYMDSYEGSLNAKYDITSSNLEVKGANGNIVAKNLNNIKISKSSLSEINAKNTKNIEIFSTSCGKKATSLHVSPDTNVGIMDKKSKINILR